MQEEEKKRVGKHAAPQPDPVDVKNVIRADADVYGDETDIPLRVRKKKKPSAAKKRSAKVKKSPAKKTRPHAKRLFARLTTSEAGYRRKTRALLEIVHSDGDNPHLKSVMIYGHRIPFGPMIAAILIIVMIAMVFLNNSNLSTAEETLTVVGLPADLEDYKILVLSDLNGKRFGDEQSSLLRTINNLDYDAVFFLGDMVGKGGDSQPFYELLEGIPSSKKVFFICGDNDPGPFVDTPRDITGTLSEMVLEDWILGAIERGATYVDSPVCLTVGSSNIWLSPATLMNLEATELLSTWKEQMEQEEDGTISGLDTDRATLPITTYRYRIAQNFYDALNSMGDDDFYVVLSHEAPSEKSIYACAEHDSADEKYLPQPELILAGHYCGGVWRLPLLGAFYIPDNMKARNGWFPAQSDVSGLSSVGETQIYITAGLSINGDTPFMAFRLFNQPQLSVLTLSATLPESMLSAE